MVKTDNTVLAPEVETMKCEFLELIAMLPINDRKEIYYELVERGILPQGGCE